MKTFKLVRQRTLFSENDIINETNKTHTISVEADRCIENYDEINTLNSVTFFDEENNEINTFELLVGDPYYKVIDENGNIIFQHHCSNHHS